MLILEDLVLKIILDSPVGKSKGESAQKAWVSVSALLLFRGK